MTLRPQQAKRLLVRLNRSSNDGPTDEGRNLRRRPAEDVNLLLGSLANGAHSEGPFLAEPGSTGTSASQPNSAGPPQSPTAFRL